MLKTLYIKNIALISELSIDFAKGFNIITGETGAGKSIIIDAISLILGDRAGKELIKTGEQNARVEAVFDISDCKLILPMLEKEELEPDDDMTITISRELSSKKDSAAVKSVCRINGTLVNVSLLKEIAEHLVDIHGQHEHQSLLEQPKHMGYLDEYAGKELKLLKENVNSIYKQYHQIENSLHSGFVSEQEREQRIDILSYQINEIEAVSPVVDEDKQLDSERNLLANSEKIMMSLCNAKELLSNGEFGALNSTKSACNELYPISELSEEYKNIANSLSEAYYSLEAAADSIKFAADTFSFDSARLEEVEARLSVLAALKRKYGNSLENVIEFYESAKNELDGIINGEQQRIKKQQELEKLAKEYVAESEKLSICRKKAAKQFSSCVIGELSKLGLKKSVFSVLITELEGKLPSSDGKDRVEFMFSANPGEPEKPLRKVASGGEISRIMLALKSVLSDSEDIGTMIFDEIDTGISGDTATTVGCEMKSISVKKQVLAITHLPQIAVFADSHYLVEKIQNENSTQSQIRLLSMNEQIDEVARIMGGKGSSLASEHAKELINKAKDMFNNCR